MRLADKKKWNSASADLQKAQSLDPDSPLIRKNLAYVIASRGHEYFEANDWYKARDDFERALRYDPKDSHIKLALSQVLYRLQAHTGEARKYFAEGVQGNAPKDVERRKAKQYAEEVQLEKISREEKRGNWILRTQEGISGFDSPQVFKTIEEVSQKTGKDFQYWIKHPLVFVLVDESKFQKVHTGPGWAGALNDGRIKVPVTGSFREAKKFKEVLAHEFTHSIINDFAHGHPVPFWFHEGMAQYESYRATGEDPSRFAHYPQLEQISKAGKLLSLNTLSQDAAAESFSSAEAALAYEEALAFVVYLEENFRFYSLLSVLKQLGQGDSLEDAMLKGIGRNFGFLEEEWRVWMHQKSKEPAR